MRPASIVWFERLFFASLIIGVTTSIIFPDHYQQRDARELGSGVRWLIELVALLIALALWYFVARRGSNLARWIYSVLVVFGVAEMGFRWGSNRALEAGGTLDGTAMTLELLDTVLGIASVMLLFRPDVKAWFASRGGRADPAAPA